MPRDVNGVYTLPAGNPVVTGTTITSTWGNTTLSDIATALTQSLSVDGSVTAAKLATNSVTTNKIADGNVTSAKIQSSPTLAGTVTLSGGQITFPAVQVPSADVNTLDDYEEGTWTPVITFATPGDLNVVYSRQLGSYTKIGNFVALFVDLQANTFTHTTASGSLQITGMPFPAAAGFTFASGLYLTGCNPTTTSADYTYRVDGGDSLMTFRSVSAGGAAQIMANTTATSGVAKIAIGSILYYV